MAACRFSDLIKEKLSGPEQDYCDWMRSFDIAIKAVKVQPEQATDLLLAWLGDTCQAEAADFLSKYDEEHPVPVER